MTEATLLGGRYEVGEQLGVGGMAEVYLGRDTRLGRDVAVKLLRNEYVNDPTFIARFRREAQSAAALNHPNIVSVYDTGDDDGVPFIVMEYVEGSTLREVLRSGGRFEPRRALEIVADICAALDYSHQTGIVHRDIKPGNVMLTPNGIVKVMDFGIARAVTSQTMTQTAGVLGTAQYLSPEQARGEHVDARSDVYSTGCLLYELLTHTPPFTGDSPVAVAYQHVREDPERPSARVSELTPAIDAVVLKALAKNPGNRYQTAHEMREDLLRAAAGQPVVATPVLATAETTMIPAAATTMVIDAVAAPERRQAKRGLAYGALALATILIFVLAAFIANRLVNDGGGEVPTPSLLGKTEQEARALIAAAGLEVGEVTQQNVPPGDKSKPGTVIDQDPLPQIKLERGDAVDFTVSIGVRDVTVPQLVGLLREEAEQRLADAGLTVAQVVPVNANRRKDEVLRAKPAAGETVKEGTGVVLEVASGNVVVPDVNALAEAEARSRIERAGLTFVKRTEERADIPAGTVIRTEPGPNAVVERGSDVVVYVSTQPSPSPSPSPTPEPTPTPTETPTLLPSGTASAIPKP